jgi:hypothetical protein
MLPGWSCEKASAPTIDISNQAEAVKSLVMPHTITDAKVGQKAIGPVMGTVITKNNLAAGAGNPEVTKALLLAALQAAGTQLNWHREFARETLTEPKPDSEKPL